MRAVVFLALLAVAAAAQLKKPSGPKVVFGVIGDWGWGPDGDYAAEDFPSQPTYGLFQKIVAKHLGEKCKQVNCRFVLGTGDNFYGQGIDKQLGPYDPQWNTSWRDVYSYPALTKIPFYHSLGNHDYGRSYYPGSSRNRSHSIWPQIEFTYLDNTKQWNLPDRFYSENPVPNSRVPVRITVFDSSPHLTVRYCSQPDSYVYASPELRENCQASEQRAQLEWFESQLQAARDDGAWSIALCHHPIRSTGQGPYIGLADKLTPILNQTKPHMWFNGHDHTTAHMRTPDASATEFFTVGASGTVEAGDGVLTANPGDLDDPSLQTSASWNATVYPAGFGWDYLLSNSGFGIVTLWKHQFRIQIWTADLFSNINAPFKVTYQGRFAKA